MVGSAIHRRLLSSGYENVLTRNRQELDLLDQSAVDSFLREHRPECVIVAAARVGGILANAERPAEFLYENLALTTNLIHSAYRHGVTRCLFLGSSCIYPKFAPQPIQEEALLTSSLEPTNEAYAIAKIAGLKMCEYYRRQYGVLYHSAMPCNLYGPGDNYDLRGSHVLPALIRKFHEAKEAGDDEVILWGTGKPRREFLHTDDLADAVLHLLQLEDPPDLVNVGAGEDVTILELAETIRSAVGFSGGITHDLSKPDGTPRKLMDSSRIRATGWRPSIDLPTGIARTYQSFLEETARGALRG